MKDARSRQPIVCQFLHQLVCREVPLAAPPKRAPPEVSDMVAEGVQRREVGRHGMLVEESSDDLRQPLPLLGDRLVSAVS